MTSVRRKLSIAVPALMMVFMWTGVIFPESTEEMDRRASMYYANKEFTKALGEWLQILEIDPENESVQKKIEILYEEKHRKDLSYQKARYYYRLAQDSLTENPQKAQEDSDRAIADFVIAYRIDPQDSDLQLMREDMRKLQEEVKIELAKKRLSEELKKRYLALMQEADTHMASNQFENALKNYREVLSFVPSDPAATEGIRNAELAISNRLKYEKIQALLASGIALFTDKNYKDARVNFEEVIDLDPKNSQAKNYLKKIDGFLEDRRNYELKRIQAEQSYVSGIENIRKKNFNQAADDFENVLSLIDNYKDTRERLASIARLKKEYAEEQRMLRLKNIDKEFQNGLLAYADARYKEALSYFEKTLVLDPANELAKKYMARVKDAIRDIEEEVVDEDSPYYELVNSLMVSGKQLYDKGDYTASRQRWEKILRLFPKNRIALEFLLKCEIRLNPAAYKEVAQGIMDEGRAFLREKKFNEALKKFELIKSISPEYADLDVLIAAARGGMEKVTAPQGVTGDVNAKYAEAMNLYAQGGKANIEKALVNFRWIIARDPNNVKALINMNKIESQLRLGGTDVVEARDRLTEKQRLMVRTYYYNGINYYTNNNFEKAIEEWRKVLAIDPTHEKARNNIRKSLVLLGR